MAWTCGGATTDDLRFTMSVSAGASGQNTFVSGWFYPTTLTAGRGLWSFGTIFGAKVGTTTSELTMNTDNTTDSVWNTSGAGITTGKWWHISWMNSCNNTGPATSWRVWIGDAETAPVEVTCTQATAPVGNFTGSAVLAIGNIGTAGTVAYQGDIGNLTVLIQGASGITCSLPVATAGTISQEAADQVLARLVRPLWQGKPDCRFFLQPTSTSSSELAHFPLDTMWVASLSAFWRRMVGSTAPLSMSDLTQSGGTMTATAPPTRPIPTWVNNPTPVWDTE